MRQGAEQLGEAARNTARSLTDLADTKLWVAWQEETRDGRATKIPKNPATGRNASVPTDPSTYGTRAEAETRGEKIQGGLGIVLGELPDGRHLVGIDLDSCRDVESGAIADWAAVVLELFDTYAEVSPSGTGVKLFFLMSAADFVKLSILIEGKTRKTFAAGEHREVAIDTARFYAVTEQRLDGSPEYFRLVPFDDAKWFITKVGPHYLEQQKSSNGRDESGSGYGFRFMRDRRVEGMSYAQAREAILRDEAEAGEWANRVDERQLKRAWENSQPAEAMQDKAATWGWNGPVIARAPNYGPPDAERSFEYKLFKNIEDDPYKPWLVDDLLGAGEFSIWFGPKGSGKSVILGDAACYIASDEEEWCGRRIRHGAVLYVAAERRAVVERRFAAWRKHHGIDNIPLAVIGGVFDLRSSKADAEAIIATARKLAAETGVEVVLIIIDTAAQVLAGGDENTKDLAAVATNVALIQNGTGAHVALVHHVPHYAPERPRGHGSLPNASDVTIRVDRHANHRLAEIYQVNDGPEDIRIHFTLISVELGTNPDTGKVTKAPVVMPIDGEDDQPAAKAKAGPRLPSSAALALKALREAVDEVGTVPPASNHIPAGVKVVTVDLWREYAYKRSVSPADTPEARKKAFKRASDKLLELGHIAVWDRHVWPTGDK
jgi:hypothetical protein